ncbi:hypothetical protein J0X19_21045 [Hymenobacter sp. BT186]|uniref:Uncharacterized protein n=1 Tax=Hymenobacter telluris TaxID=2816474 RepID=A0A939JFI6_9BACT|nr:hypothetical protein [Hymenobacter telluris]MBO0360462.1 hypothetical protein [Hymenobacter telluris]MBW3376489.1 hypothetical protein [Hymenobacter norwichensis]
MKQLLLSLLGAGVLLTSCKSDNEAAVEKLQQVAAAAANSPEAKARAAAWSLATTKPSQLPADKPVDLRPALEQLLPKDGYLQLVSVKAAGAAQPAILQLPILWRPIKGNYPPVAPGYRLPFEAVLKWKPMGYGPGEKIPAAMALDGPWTPDTLNTFSLREPEVTVPGQAATAPMLLKPGQAVTVRGVAYAYATSPAAGQAPRLVLYPYQNPLGPPEARNMVYLPL